MPHSRQLNELANIYASMGLMLWCAAWQWPLLLRYPHRRPNLRLIIGGRA